MSDNMEKKFKRPSKSSHSGRKKKSTSQAAGSPKKRSTGKSKLAGRTVEMSSGNQVTIDDIMVEPEDTENEPSPKPSKSNGVSLEKSQDNTAVESHPDDDVEMFPDNTDAFEVPPSEGDGIAWNKQASSIIIWMVSVILLALTVFPGESIWTVIHNVLLGIFGFKSLLWVSLLIIWGYLMTKQADERMSLNLIRKAGGIILLTDVLGYILVQSNGYRNVYNEPSFGFFQLFEQIFRDGGKIGGTGLLGGTLGELLMAVAGKNGAIIISSVLLLALIMVISRTGPLELYYQAKRGIKMLFTPAFYRELFTGTYKRPEEFQYDYYSPFGDEEVYDVDVFSEEEPDEPAKDEEMEHDVPEPEPNAENPDGKSLDEIVKISLKKKKKLTKAEEIKAESEEFSKQVESGESKPGEPEANEYKYPPVRLLLPQKNSNTADDEQELNETGAKLIRTLEEYSVKASISHISRGPTVTRYEINPAPGVKINKIKNLSDDIALRLAAQSIRIEAPIPGKSAVGIEIPNKNKQMVRIREILGSRDFAEAKGSLIVALGKDIEGNIVLCDLSKMPHLLIAGSTGSGKSVCVNSMLMSILYKYSPKQVRMVLIDPKSVEFDMYNGIPHLLVPVVCEPKKAAGALQWAVSEMLKRYGMLKERGARNIDNYNRLAEQTGEFEKLCRIVIVIDEMADLMIASPKEVEDSIARLAAMARAAGMYMVLATQRPSVDVITGTIKNNIPSRIALAVSSQVDSRTILDEGGAENLIGYGDMLYHPMGSSKNIRVQGCFVDDSEVGRVISFVKQNGLAEYDDSIADEIERNSLDKAGDDSSEFEGKDEFFEKAVEVVTEAGQASTSMLQRRLGVGYARAGRIIDQLEEHGIIGPHEGSKPRAVLITRTQWMEMTMSRTHAGKNDPILRSHSEFAAQTLDNGHEEIAARQSEFFNANLVDDYEEEDYEPAESPTDDGTETELRDAAIEVDMESGSFMPLEEPMKSEPVIRDLTRFLFDTDEEYSNGPSDIVVEDISPVNGYQPSGADFRPDGGEAASYDSAEAVTDEAYEEEEEAFTENDDGHAEVMPEDIPPWEEPDFSFDDGAHAEPSSDTHISSDTDEEVESEEDKAEEDDMSADDDDSDDDILFSSWIKKL